ncbi:MAG: hypothetical protein AAF242_07675 [Bacteroidota bacterium]
MLKSIHLVLLLLSTNALLSKEVKIDFFGHDFHFEYTEEISPRSSVQVEADALRRFYGAMERRPYQSLLSNLNLAKDRFALNDWLYYQLVHKVSRRILSTKSEATQSLFTWFLLTKSGYDIRLTFRDQQVYLCAYIEEKVFEVPLIKQEQRTYVNLTEVGTQNTDRVPVYILDYVPNPRGLPFSFSLQQKPMLEEDIVEKEIKFRFNDSLYQWNIAFDRTLVRLMESYPFIDETEYVLAPMSGALINTIIPKIKHATQSMSTVDQVRFITVFTRSAFRYKEDKAYFGKSKPMIPDELFHYPFSDCEDRSAIFYALVRATLSLPMVLVAYPDHMTVAVHIPNTKGEAIYYRGKPYLVCDPTGPNNSSAIGRIPKELKGVPYEIIHHFSAL